MHWRVKVYNMFAVSILQFYLQFYGVTPSLLQAEREALVKVFKGPGNWLPSDIRKGLKTQLGACYGVLDLQQVSNAAKVRLILTESNLHLSNLQDEIKTEWRKGTFYLQGEGFQGNHPWTRWYGEGTLASIYRADHLLRERKSTRASILQKVQAEQPKAEWKKAKAPPSENGHGAPGKRG